MQVAPLTPDAEPWSVRSVLLNGAHVPSAPTQTTCLKTAICWLHVMIGTGSTHWPAQPFRVMLSVKVNELPLAIGPALTLTEAPVVEPLMVPFPLIDQL